MNQILNGFEHSFYSSTHANSKRAFLKTTLIISVLIIIGCIFYFIQKMLLEHKNQKIATQMLNHFNVTTLYSTSSHYSTDISTENQTLFVIGMITISSIDVHYPILSEINEENLKIAPCRFFGPMPNEVGNLCIAAHNYRNDKFFSKLDDLKDQDPIEIYDGSGNKVTYLIYDKYIADSSSLACTSQDTNGEKEITLITCNKPDNSKRIVVKAKEKK